jgi:hypothetical protein
VPLMVVSALQRGPADFVLSLEEIAELLIALAGGVHGTSRRRPDDE